MIFVGQFFILDVFGQFDFIEFVVFIQMFNNIRDWFLACESNLVIVIQAEVCLWGYIMANQNINFNIFEEEIFVFFIFDGLFGSFSFFNQGGFYQGVFIGLLIMGFEIFVNDVIGVFMVVLDEVMNDIILGDVGILCFNGAGEIFLGNSIVNNNDILVANIFVLGCWIVEGIFILDQVFMVCEGELVVFLDGGVVNVLGEYLDILIVVNGCDFIVFM